MPRRAYPDMSADLPPRRIVSVSRADLRALVAIHRAMFDKLLAGDDDPVCPELIALFADLAATYRDINRTLRDIARDEARHTKIYRSKSHCSGAKRKASGDADGSERQTCARSQGLASLNASQSQS